MHNQSQKVIAPEIEKKGKKNEETKPLTIPIRAAKAGSPAEVHRALSCISLSGFVFCFLFFLHENVNMNKVVNQSLQRLIFT